VTSQRIDSTKSYQCYDFQEQFLDLGFPPEEAAVLALRADLMGRLRLLIDERGWNQVQAAEQLGISQSRVSDLVRGKW
jgi:predicted XRE-type DNA-binding protein